MRVSALIERCSSMSIHVQVEGGHLSAGERIVLVDSLVDVPRARHAGWAGGQVTRANSYGVAAARGRDGDTPLHHIERFCLVICPGESTDLVQGVEVCVGGGFRAHRPAQTAGPALRSPNQLTSQPQVGHLNTPRP